MPSSTPSARFLTAVKVTAGCVDCGTSVGKLDFDHRDKATKLFSVSQHRDRQIRAVVGEVMKCDVRCARCHVLRHLAEGKLPPNGVKRPPCFCGVPSEALGLCQKHYWRLRRHGDVHVRYGKTVAD